MALSLGARPRGASQTFSTADLSPATIAKNIIKSALAAELRSEPVLRSFPAVERAYGLIQSVVCRHGGVIQQMLGDGVAQGERFEVLRNHPVPVSAAALECVNSRTSEDVLRALTLSSSSAVHHIVVVDLVIIHLQRGWVGVFDCKRGWSPTASARRREIETDLRAMRLTLPSFARRLGFPQVDISTGAVIDFYGNAGFREEMTLHRDEIDRFFEMPVVGRLERMTKALEKELGKAVHDILGLSKISSVTRDEIARIDGKVVSLFRERAPDRPDPSTSDRD